MGVLQSPIQLRTTCCAGWIENQRKPINRFAIAIMFLAFLPTGAAAQDSCRAQANANKLKGTDFRTFMANCKVVVQMVCDGRVIDQKIADEAKESFVKHCIKDGLLTSVTWSLHSHYPL